MAFMTSSWFLILGEADPLGFLPVAGDGLEGFVILLLLLLNASVDWALVLSRREEADVDPGGLPRRPGGMMKSIRMLVF